MQPFGRLSVDLDARWRRESTILVVMAFVGAALELPLALVGIPNLHMPGRAAFLIWALSGAAALIVIVPIAVRLNPQLGLPGAPLLVSSLFHEEQPYGFWRVIRVGVIWGLGLVAALFLILLIILAIALLLPHATSTHVTVPRFSRSLPDSLPAPGPLAAAALLASFGAGVSEEILFRLGLIAVLARVGASLCRASGNRPAKSVLWTATILQAYLFGLVHVFPGGNLTIVFGTKANPFLEALLTPQTWEGLVLGRLYLRRGLEAAIVAHIVLDLTIFSILTVALVLMRHRV
jgi:membrane protease YdiL (CAAX protease family)